MSRTGREFKAHGTAPATSQRQDHAACGWEAQGANLLNKFQKHGRDSKCRGEEVNQGQAQTVRSTQMFGA